jgi:hypothetical protein
MEYSEGMKREDIIRDIHGLDAELAALEEQYGLLSSDFYHCYRAGELEQTRDFIRWAGFYEAKQERKGGIRLMSEARDDSKAQPKGLNHGFHGFHG